MAKKYILPDTHFGEIERPNDQVHAINSFLDHAADADAEVLHIGDYVELGPVANLGMVRREIGKTLAAFSHYQAKTGRPIQVVRGNHEPSLTNELLESELTPGVRHQIHNTMLVDEKDGVVLHHGDLADVKNGNLADYLATYKGNDSKALIEFFEEKERDTPSKYSEDRQLYHAHNMIFVWDVMRILQKFGTSLETQLAIYDWFARRAFRNKVEESIKTKKVIPGAPAEFTFNTWLMDQTNAWAIVQGHTHLPSHITWENQDRSRKAIIANAGSIYTTARAPTAVILDTDARSSTLVAYRDGAWRADNTMVAEDDPKLFIPNL